MAAMFCLVLSFLATSVAGMNGIGIGGGGMNDLGVGNGMMLGGYIPDNTPFSNPGTLEELTPTIPTTPECSVRPQTIVEIQRMRETATSIAQSVQREVVIMNRRKAYIEQMTAYLNDRIRELNKVKSELAEEVKWITVSQNRIKELAEREKLVKYQDILSCLNTNTKRMEGMSSVQTATKTKIDAQNTKVLEKIQALQSEIAEVQKGQKQGGQ